MEPSGNTPGRVRANRDFETANQKFKRAVRERLILLRSREFASEVRIPKKMNAQSEGK